MYTYINVCVWSYIIMYSVKLYTASSNIDLVVYGSKMTAINTFHKMRIDMNIDMQ